MRYAAFILLIITVLPTRHASAQPPQIPGGVGDTPGGGFPAPAQPVDTGDLTNGGDGGTGGGGGGGGGTGGSDGIVEPVELELGGDVEDSRNQGFVGVTADRVQELGFVGASSETSGPPLSDGATFGGGVNNSGTQAGGGGGNQIGGGGVNGVFGGQNQSGGGTQNGFQVIRQSLRTNLVPLIYAAPVSNEQTVIRFQNRIARQPVPRTRNQTVPVFSSTGGPVSSVNVQVENRTAVLTGYVGSPSERDRWERQLRLEPGVDRIINQIEVTTAALGSTK